MNKDFLHKISESMHGFSKGQKKIGNFILSHYDKAAFMTAAKLGEAVGVSESTVVRFAAELGYDGYPAMQKAMQEMVVNRLTSVQRIEVANDRIGDQDVVSTVLQADIDRLRKSQDMVDREEFRAAVDTAGQGGAVPLVTIWASHSEKLLMAVDQ